MYANPTSSSFAPLFLALYNLAAPPTGQPRIQLALRWKSNTFRAHGKEAKLVLSGYGALLDIKKVDYIAIDDRAKKVESVGGEAVEAVKDGPRIYPVSDDNLDSEWQRQLSV